MTEQISEQAQKNFNNWIQDSSVSQPDKDQIQSLKTKNDIIEINDSFGKDLAFGTGGMRAVMGLGSNRMNGYNVKKASQALATAILTSFPKTKEPKISVSFDCRHHSQDFAQKVCEVMAGNGIQSFIFKELTPTPMLSYAIRQLEAQGGVMITASHNPPKYNGYKAYWADGAQVTPPNDQKIIDNFGKINSFAEVKSIEFEEAIKKGLIKYISDELITNYDNMIKRFCLEPQTCLNQGHQVSIIYTPLHGTGKVPCERVSKALGFSRFQVFEPQASFDGNFPTVKSPNPEDAEAMDSSVKEMLATNADAAYGTDPDCDRLGVVVNHQGQAIYLNGNQISLLMLDYIIKSKKQTSTFPNNPLVIKSIVTSKLIDQICKHHEINLIETLTGFKWMAKELYDLDEKNESYDYLFASEESFGFMPSAEVRDKDGVHAVALMNEIILHHKLKGRTLIHGLDLIYEKYGFCEESLIAKTFEGNAGTDKINRIMNFFREGQVDQISNIKFAITFDFDSLIETDLASKKVSEINMTSSNVLGFRMENGDYIYLRPSGTEPKIKFYLMTNETEGTLENRKISTKNRIKSYTAEIEEIIAKI
ncbi:phospho-sugar mutase [Bacteriovoracaceae bacterium]|nr:phospho-sugar mutase [Bacteriovoracaceae bacterium]